MILDNGPPEPHWPRLDLGHAHITVGVAEAIATLSNRIVQRPCARQSRRKKTSTSAGDGPPSDGRPLLKFSRGLTAAPCYGLEISQNLGIAESEIPRQGQEKGFNLFA